MKKQEVIEFLVNQYACKPAIAWLNEQSGGIKAIYKRCNNNDWLEWLYEEIGLTSEYLRVTQPAREEYLRVKQSAWEEYERVTQPAREEYLRKCKLPWTIVRSALKRAMEVKYDKL